MDRFSNPALLIVDMQNDFVRQGAPLEVPQARDSLPLHRRLIEACRANEAPIVYTKFLAGPKRTLIWEWSPVLAPPLPLVAADKFSFRQDVPLHRLFQVRFCSRGL